MGDEFDSSSEAAAAARLTFQQRLQAKRLMDQLGQDGVADLIRLVNELGTEGVGELLRMVEREREARSRLARWSEKLIGQLLVGGVIGALGLMLAGAIVWWQKNVGGGGQ